MRPEALPYLKATVGVVHHKRDRDAVRCSTYAGTDPQLPRTIELLKPRSRRRQGHPCPCKAGFLREDRQAAERVLRLSLLPAGCRDTTPSQWRVDIMERRLRKHGVRVCYEQLTI